MSTRFSPDGMYYWNGAQWVSTISPDGRYRWDGANWVPAGYGYGAPLMPAPPTRREPTSWTRPLQYAVAGWYGITGLISLTVPFWMGGQMSQIMRASIAQQEAQSPNVTPPPQSFYDMMNGIVTASLWVAAGFGIALAILFIVAAINRWVWAYYVVLVLLGLGVVSGPANFLRFGATASFGYTPPAWFFAYGIVTWLVSTALFVVLLIALIRRGPWGMRKVSAGAQPAA